MTLLHHEGTDKSTITSTKNGILAYIHRRKDHIEIYLEQYIDIEAFYSVMKEIWVEEKEFMKYKFPVYVLKQVLDHQIVISGLIIDDGCVISKKSINYLMNGLVIYKEHLFTGEI